MQVATMSVKRPRKLVVRLYHQSSWLDDMIEADQTYHPQRVHEHKLTQTERRSQDVEPLNTENSSRIDRLAIRLGVRKAIKPSAPANDDPGAEAYAFISRNYAAGDQVILCVDSLTRSGVDSLLHTAEALARHLVRRTAAIEMSIPVTSAGSMMARAQVMPRMLSPGTE
ncbi:hypothetical protein B0J17DRAFT_677943 [Rhizoctonia solani]|nr:hypothetical protein B0J17DRAFT_677943 [Rhizoctonia solani]